MTRAEASQSTSATVCDQLMPVALRADARRGHAAATATRSIPPTTPTAHARPRSTCRCCSRPSTPEAEHPRSAATGASIVADMVRLKFVNPPRVDRDHRQIKLQTLEWSRIGASVSRNTLSIFDRGRSDTSPASKLFNVSDDLSKVFERDRAVAGIAKSDDRGRTVDVHALRHTFGTMLSKAGVSPRVAQAAMRHSSIDLTMNVYTDPRLLDVHSALDALPMLPLDSSPIKDSQTMRATGTDDFNASNLVAPTHDFSSPTVSFRGTMPNQRADFDGQPLLVVSADAVKKNARRHSQTASVLKLPGEDLNLD